MRVGRIASLIATLALAGCSPGLPMRLAEFGSEAMTEVPLALAKPSPSRPALPRQDLFGRFGSVSLHLGARRLDDPAWSPVDQPTVFGIESEFRLADSPLGVELGGSVSYDTGTTGSQVDVRSLLYEIYFGPRVTVSWPDSPVDLYVGGGLSIVGAERVTEFLSMKIDDVDRSAAAYVHGGTQIWVNDSFAVGLDARLVSGTDVDLLGVQNLDYVQVTLTLGFGF